MMVVEERLGKLEKSVTKIQIHQGSMSQSVAGINETLATLADIRAETLHLMKTQEHARKERDEIFKRLREVEAAKEVSVTNQSHTDKTLTDLEDDVEILKLWKSAHVSSADTAEKAGLKAGRFWGMVCGTISILISGLGLYFKFTGKV